MSVPAHSPDASAAGLVAIPPDPMRYEWRGVFGPDDVTEVPAIVARWLPQAARVLDVGCGSGAITELLARSTAVEVMGVEPDPERSAAARARGLDVATALMDADFLRANGPFDVILFTDVLEHLTAPAEMLATARQGLKPGGVIIASVPNVAHWSVRLRLMAGRFDYTDMGIMDATHLRWFTAKSFRALFEGQGLTVVAQEASTGAWLPEYRKLPFRLLPKGVRRRLVRALTAAFPRLFGCQHVVMATPGS